MCVTVHCTQLRLGRDATPMAAFPKHPFDVEYNLVASFAFDDLTESLTLLGEGLLNATP